MLPEQQTPLVLTAMTLRGIGSYLQGARLELKPLTVLCGKNGSGKSTWLRTLNLLSKSLRAGKLPFGFEVTDGAADNFQPENAFYCRAEPEDHARIADPNATLEFGPPGAIGLEFKAVRDFNLPDVTDALDACSGVPQEFLWLGRCPAGTRFRIRIAHPTYWNDAKPTPELCHLIELQLDGRFVVSMRGERDPSQRFEVGHSRPSRSRPYQLACSGAFLPGSDLSNTDALPLATVTDLVHWHCEPPSMLAGADTHLFDYRVSELCSDTVDYFDIRLRQLLEIILGGYFYIGAVRQPQTGEALKPADVAVARSRRQDRHVGGAGEHAWVLERQFADLLMRQASIPEDFQAEEFGGGWYSILGLEYRSKDERLARIWEVAAVEPRSMVERLFTEGERLSDEEDPDGFDRFRRFRDRDDEFKECVAKMLSSVLRNRDLFSPAWLPHGEYRGDPEITYYASKGVESLSQRDLVRLNRLLVEDVLLWSAEEFRNLDPPFLSSYWFEEYVSHWLSVLIEAKVLDPGSVEQPRSPRRVSCKQAQAIRSPFGEKFTTAPTGFLLQPDSCDPELSDVHKLHLRRLTHPCFGNLVGTPAQFSSGFHQVFPIIVQLGLMRQGELIGIENPEVHLHPSAQLEITQALAAHAASGRLILVETHSDLVVRRVIRSVLEEDLSQAQVRIYFTDIEREVSGPSGAALRYSTLNPIRMDERGRISNWPEGFLNDDVRESQRLLDIMYGGPDSGNEDDE
jgi:ABC-type transport system involved in cytochrome c biogenesis ATPase subunit